MELIIFLISRPVEYVFLFQWVLILKYYHPASTKLLSTGFIPALKRRGDQAKPKKGRFFIIINS